MTVITVVPAYGRDYKSKAAVQADWDANKDFTICDVLSRYDGSKINKPDAHGISIRVRYDGSRKVAWLQNEPKAGKVKKGTVVGVKPEAKE